MVRRLRFRPEDGLGTRMARTLLGPLLLAVFRVRAEGLDNIPDGPVLLAGNHVSYMDPVLLWCASPRPAHFMAKHELWDSRLLAWAMDRVYTFPVNREIADRSALTEGVRLLKAGEIVGIFPEGTRREDAAEVGQAHGGAAFLALHTGAPVVPVGIAGTDKVWPRGRRFPRLAHVTMSLGAPLYPSAYEGEGRKGRVQAMTTDIMRRIGEQLTVAQELDARR